MSEIYQPTDKDFEKAESLLTNDQREMSHQREEKGNTLRHIRKEIDETGDALGKPIDEGIKETVVFLNALGIPTASSCEGHTDWGAPWPHIGVEAPNEPKERWENQNSIFQETAEKYSISFEDVKRANSLDAWEEAINKSAKNPETAAFKEWRKENKKLFERVKQFLKEFYQGRQDIDSDNKLTLSELGGAEFSITFPDTSLVYEMIQQKREELNEKLHQRRAEMAAFTKFLENKYWEM